MGKVIELNQYKEDKLKRELEEEERLMEEERIEFIHLLQLFASLSESKYNIMHIIPCDNRYDAFDENGNEIDLKADFGDIDFTDINYKDLLVSNLILYNPKRIILYNSDKIDAEVKKTINEVFEGNVVESTEDYIR